MDAAAAWLESIGAEPNLPGQDECPGCDGGPCMWATHIYPQPDDGTVPASTTEKEHQNDE